MTGNLTAQGLADYQKSVLVAVPTAVVSFPGGNTRRYSIEGSPLASSLGIYRDRLKDISDIEYRTSDPRGGLQGVTWTMRIADLDGDIRAMVNRYGQAALRGSAIVVSDATKSNPADWPRHATGIIDGIEPSGSSEWTIAGRVDDRPLIDGTFRSPRITAADYPNVLAPNIERQIPIVLGVFDSRDGTVAGSTGSIELIRLGESDGTGGFPYRYLVASPYLSGVKRVTNTGTTVSSSTWVRTYTLRKGVATTEVWFSTDPGSSAKMAAEVLGAGQDVSGSSIYLGASGTGEPITNIVAQLRWLLRNYVWSAYRFGPLASDPAAFKSASWDVAEAWANKKAFSGGILIKEASQRPLDVFNAVCQWAWLRAGWDQYGQLLLAPFTDEDEPVFSDSRWIRYAIRGSEDALLPSMPRDRTVHGMRSPTWVVPASDASRSIVTVRDSRVLGNVVTEVAHELGVARQEFQYAYPGSSNMILALDGSRPGIQGGTPVYLSGGGSLTSWRDINWSPASSGFDFPNSFRTAMTPVAPGGNEPTWIPGLINGHGGVRFDGTNDYMVNASAAANGAAWTLWAVIRVLGASRNDAVPRNNHGIIVSNSGYWGLHVRTSAGIYYLQAQVFLGAGHAYVEYPVTLGAWYIVRARNYSGTLYLSINNWDELSVTSFMSNPNSLVRLGSNDPLAGSPNGYFTGDIASVIMLDNGDIAGQGATSGNITPALGHNFDIWRSLKDRYRL